MGMRRAGFAVGSRRRRLGARAALLAVGLAVVGAPTGPVSPAVAASQLGRRIPVRVVQEHDRCLTARSRLRPPSWPASGRGASWPATITRFAAYLLHSRPVSQRRLGKGGIGTAASSPLTANLTDPFLKSALGVADPQIAAGPVYLATTQRNVFAIFDKSGVPVSQTLFGAPAKLPARLCDMFSPLLGDLNAHADLPGGATGIDGANGWGFDCGPSGVGKTFYDARIVDDFRHRYWIAALAINHKVAELIHADKVAGTPVPPEILGARRGKFVVAVSQTDDPRGGWNEYWFDANKGDGQCNPNCTVENGADYPFIAVSHHFFLWSSIAGPEADPYRNVAVINADWMASAGSCSFECGWDFTNFNIDPGPENLDPVIDHGAAPDHTAMLIAPRGNNRIALWTLKVSNGSPSWSAVALNVNPFNMPTAVNQPSTGSVPNPQQLSLGNAGNDVMRAVYRDSRLVVTFAECKVWSGTNTCTTAVRLIQLRHTPSGWVVHRDQTFGRADPPDPRGRSPACRSRGRVEQGRRHRRRLPALRQNSAGPGAIQHLPSQPERSGHQPADRRRQLDRRGQGDGGQPDLLQHRHGWDLDRRLR